jgi:hypothetical protein
LNIGRLDSVLQKGAVDFLGQCVDERGIALELGKSERRPEAPDYRVHQISDDVLSMVEFDLGKEARVARDIGDGEIGQFRLRKQYNLL